MKTPRCATQETDQMFKTTTAALLGLTLACAGGGAFAQGSAMKPADGKMMAGKMSDKDMATMKMCKEMPHDAMAKDARCMDMMKMHPDAMKTDSAMMKGAPAK
jgi:hypothetical protein